MGSQPFPGAFFDQQVDQRQAARLVNRVSQQGLIAVVIEIPRPAYSSHAPAHFDPIVYQAAERRNSLLGAFSRAALRVRRCKPPEPERRGAYLGCAVFGLAASWARVAIQASYSGVPRRGGTPGGMPPIHCGMSASRSPAVLPAQDVSTMPARPRKAQARIGRNRFIHWRCHGNVAASIRNQGRDGTVAVPGRFPSTMQHTRWVCGRGIY